MEVKSWPDATGSSTFWVKVRKVSDLNWDVNLPWKTRDMTVGIYVMGQVGNNAQLIARRVLYAQYKVTLGTTTSSDLFKYGLLSGGTMNFGGSAMVYGGDKRSSGAIDFGSQYRLAELSTLPDSDYTYKVYTDHGITGNKNVIDDASQYVAKPGGDFVFPAIDLTHYRTMADDFKGGTGFYSAAIPPDPTKASGDPANPSIIYPDTSNTTVQQLIVADLGAVGTSSTFAQVTTFNDHVTNRTGGIPSVPLGWKSVSDTVYNQIVTNLSCATYYIKQSDQIAGGSAKGTVVFDCPAGGGVTFTGGTLNTEGNYGLALLVNGDLTINGNTIIYGGVYATGKIQKMNGDFKVYGSIATQGAMDNVQGNFTVYYHKISGISPIYTTSGVIAAVEPLNADQNGSWREKDLDAFTNAP